ncbi:MAG: sulfatase [Planctomycetota bacterium]|nr:sulfatase [Planctomycetota bacterium]
MTWFPRLYALFFLFAIAAVCVSSGQCQDRPNVLLIICDDLNDYIAGLDGHPQSRTPAIEKLSRQACLFTEAHCNIPICGPSRASLFSGIYPHHSGCFGFERWDRYPVLQNSKMMMELFRENGYQTLGTGKLLHHHAKKLWDRFGHLADYGPFAFDGQDRVAHPQVPAPFREIGTVDGSFGPLIPLEGISFPDGKKYSWKTGNWKRYEELRVVSRKERSRTGDERNALWAAEQLRQLADSDSDQPFFMGVGFLRPHTPLIVPQEYFDRYPLDSIRLPEIRPGDVEDTFAASVRGESDKGSEMYTRLLESYPDRETALKHFIQAYLASVASVDDLVGDLMEVLEQTGLVKNTIVILTSDHGWGMGEKDYLYKNSLWQESTRIPLIVKLPGQSSPREISHPVSLVDLYPTLVELCGLEGTTVRNRQGHSLDGFSLLPLMNPRGSVAYRGPDEVLVALYKWAQRYEPLQQSYSLRSRSWRYIRYENGKEELYDCAADPLEWHNLVDRDDRLDTLKEFRARIREWLPADLATPPQPEAAGNSNKGPGKTGGKKSGPQDAEKWKAAYFKKHPAADANRDGKLTWPELKAYRQKIGELPSKK